jgi:hypothetical protein
MSLVNFRKKFDLILRFLPEFRCSNIFAVTEHTRKCLKVEYPGRIEYDFQKSRVTGPWDHKDSVSAKNFLLVHL